MPTLSRSRDAGSLLYDPRVRALVYQALVAVAVAALCAFAYTTIASNLRRLGVTSGFAFLSREGQFGLSQSLIDFNERSTYGRAFVAALLNTLLVSILAIVSATLLGVAVGFARVARTEMLRGLATAYVELNRNIPLLLHLLFWYYVVLAALPNVRQSLIVAGIVLNNRGLIVPAPSLPPSAIAAIAVALAGLIATVWLARRARRHQELTGRRVRVWPIPAGLVIALPALILIVAGEPIVWDFPTPRGLLFRGGVTLRPELVALWVALTLYHSAFVAEIVRAGVQSVEPVQYEAAAALSFTSLRTLRLVVLPQAMRVIIPPLGNNLLGIIKDTALGASVGYPDLMQVFWVTVLFQTGQGVEIVAITMCTYLVISLAVSALINAYNRAHAMPGHAS